MAARTSPSSTPKVKSRPKVAPAAKPAAKATSTSKRIGRGTRWTEAEVQLLLDTVTASSTAKDAFEQVARELGKSAGTVQQKYYNMKRKAGGPSRRGRRAATTRAASAPRASRGSASAAIRTPSSADLRLLTVDELVALASRVRGEVDRRRSELDAAARQLKG